MEIHTVSDTDQSALLMQMALADLTDNDSKWSCRVRVFFDTGSTRFCISDATQNTLNADVNGEDALSIALFGSKKRETKVLKRVQIQVKTIDGGSVPITANITQTSVLR